MSEFEAREPVGPDGGVELVDRGEGQYPQTVLRILDSRTDPANGHCHSHKQDLQPVKIPEGWTVVVDHEYRLPLQYGITVCPICVEHIGSIPDGDWKGAVRLLLKRHWEKDLLREPFELADRLTNEERLDDLEDQVADLLNRVRELEGQVDAPRSEVGESRYTTENMPGGN